MNGAHSVQFFDGEDSLGAAVAAYFLEGLRTGAHLVLLARARNVETIAERLAGRGYPLSELVDEGRLTTFDTAATLRTFMVNGRPNLAAFEEAVVAPIRELAARHTGGVCAYGELVDVLAADDNIRASEDLERLWNGVLAELPRLQVHCGYTSAHFADERLARSMKSICDHHHHVVRDESDLLANWLLAQHA